MIYSITILEKKFSGTYLLWRYRILYLTWYLIFPAFWSHIVLSKKIGQYTKNKLMINKFFGDRKFDVIGI